MAFKLPLTSSPLNLTKTLTAVLVAAGVLSGVTMSVAAPITSTPQNFDFAIHTSGNVFIPADSQDAPGFHTFTGSATSTFNEFDSSLGTLQQVVFTWQSPLSARVSFGPPGFDDSLHASIAPTVSAEIGGGVGTLFSSPFSATGATGQTVLNVTASVNNSRTYSAPGDLALFIGTGTFNTVLNLAVKVGADNGTADMSADWGTQANQGRLSLEYIYEARPTTGQLPEPGVPLLLGTLAAIGIGVTVRKRGQAGR